MNNSNYSYYENKVRNIKSGVLKVRNKKIIWTFLLFLIATFIIAISEKGKDDFKFYSIFYLSISLIFILPIIVYYKIVSNQFNKFLRNIKKRNIETLYITPYKIKKLSFVTELYRSGYDKRVIGYKLYIKNNNKKIIVKYLLDKPFEYNSSDRKNVNKHIMKLFRNLPKKPFIITYEKKSKMVISCFHNFNVDYE